MFAKATSDYGDVVSLGPRLKEFLSRKLQRDLKIEDLTRYPVGFSWMTYGFTLAEQPAGVIRRELVLRLAPPVGILPPYAAKPEFDVLTAIFGRGVPVPQPVFYSDDRKELGAPFLICSKAPGAPHTLAGAPPLPEQIPLLSKWAEQFTDILARLHNIDWVAVLGENTALGATVSDIAVRQVDHWNQIAETVALRPLPILRFVYHWLLESAPVAPKLSIVHGDYRLGNFLARDSIDAILDWELTHIGDPHEDWGWALLPNFNGRTSKLFGALPREEVFERYERKTGLSLRPKSIAYYEVLALFKLAVICLSGNHAFFVGHSHDLRLPVMGSSGHFVLRKLAELMERM
ncbi:phosphotransferase family protein [Bradyrhizobium sp. SHOUNA76]|uniref:phosphotransferase family protein n=1 Tax=Bradyrhizobium sp. SHOUNA76 TaxID=2908927 RepID=UPI001FF32B29|nr:phosphotransferase family protein [Bradyrhizobium sp. SHOUNA76]MCJ9699615.1 phosphotransferase family protein [Bradyrhizobium sp. SHOUNA76]